MATLCFLDSMFKLKNVVTICASKYFNTDEIRKINNLGIFDFGENRTKDLLSKKLELSDLNLTWHFIGHLQTNKVKSIINEIDYLHTLDSLNLANEINKYRKNPLNVFIQINLSKENQKSGILVEYLPQFYQSLKKYDKIRVIGLMTIGKLNDDNITKEIFATLESLAKKYQLPYLSMGMSNDYKIALEFGATHLRIGSKFKDLI